jgi:hypothetical protein
MGPYYTTNEIIGFIVCCRVKVTWMARPVGRYWRWPTKDASEGPTK